MNWPLRFRPRYNEPLDEAHAEPLPPAIEGDTLVWLALSGGGTRAAAFAWAALEALRGVRLPVTRGGEFRLSNLADEIDVVSGISGGSFAAAAWCLFRERPEVFRQRFLEVDYQKRIFGGVTGPGRALRLMSAEYDRINVAAELYDEQIFEGATFGDLPERPELLTHATHLALGDRFSFTHEDFALIGSDLSSYPVGYACAACSAFPGLLSPLTLLNHGETLPLETLRERDRVYRRARRYDRRSVEEGNLRVAREFYNDKRNRYIHLADGGLVDNQGLQAVLDAFVGHGRIQRKLGNRDDPLRRLILINVNAGTRPRDETARNVKAPGVRSVLLYTMVTSMDLLSAKRWVAIQAVCNDRYQPIIDGAPVAYAGMEEPYTIEISFRNVADPEVRRRCYDLPTSFKLSAEERALIDSVTPALVHEDPHMVRLEQAVERQLAG